MGVYGNEVLNEALFFISNNGKELKKKIKTELKTLNSGFGDSLVKSLRGKTIDSTLVKKSHDMIKKIMEDCVISKTYVVVTTYGDGTQVEENRYDVFGVYKGKYYIFYCFPSASNCRLGAFFEYDPVKCGVDIKIIKYALSLINDNTRLELKKQALIFSDVVTNRDAASMSYFDEYGEKIVQYCKSNFPDLPVQYKHGSLVSRSKVVFK